MKVMEKLKNEIRSALEGHRLAISHDKYEGADRVTINVTEDGSDGVNITFAELKALSTILGTDLIDVEQNGGTSGCETCDYGAVSECDIVCRGVARGMS